MNKFYLAGGCLLMAILNVIISYQTGSLYSSFAAGFCCAMSVVIGSDK